MVLFARLPLRHALIWGLIVGHLFLPENFSFNFSGLPPFDKSMVSVSALLLAVLIYRNPSHAHRSIKVEEVQPLVDQNRAFGYLVIGLVVLTLFTPILTILVNRAPIVIGDRVLSGLRPWDYLSMVSRIVVSIAPYFLARHFLATPNDHRLLLRVLIMTGIVYSALILLEIRLSPQLHKWVYGYHQASFVQHFRGGGFRPKVFLPHGLWVGFFIFTVAIAAFSLARNKDMLRRGKYFLAGMWFLVILILSKNLTASVLGILLITFIWTKKYWQIQLVTIITSLFLIYPFLRQYNIIPVEQVTSLTMRISKDRADSFQFRIRNENILLDRARQKPVFGWGEWGRSRVYDADGRDISITDGAWIVVLGTSGWLGYIGFFGLLTAPILALRRTTRRKDIPVETLGLALIMAGNLIYLVPNSTLGPIGWLIAGSLAGFVQFDPAQSEIRDANEPKPESRKNRYTRFPHRPRHAR